MQYKTMALELLRQHPEIHGPLCRQQQFLPTLERYARELKTRHEWWKEQLLQARPESHPSQLASEAMEIALQELQDHLSSASAPDEHEPLSLDAAMAFLRRHTPPG